MSQKALCGYFKRSPQGLRKRVKLLRYRREQSELACEAVRRIRKRQPRAGTRKMRAEVNRQLMLQGYAPVGRDQLFDALRQRGLLVKRHRRGVRTTYAHHRFRTYGNLLRHTLQSGPNQAWAADITYLRLAGGRYCYLFLLTDVYSRKIVG